MRQLGKLWRLFVDDRWLAAAVPLWCLALALSAPHLPPPWRGPLLLAGLATALAASVVRGARGHAKVLGGSDTPGAEL